MIHTTTMVAINDVGIILSLLLPPVGLFAGRLAVPYRPAIAARALPLLAVCGLAMVLLSGGVVFVAALIGPDATYIATGLAWLSTFFAAGFVAGVKIKSVAWQVALGVLLTPVSFVCFSIYALVFLCGLRGSCL
jgi:uncharacterized membrane protein YqaE (UPF0057 family)